MEFSHSFNAMSMLFPPLERFLNRVMIMARSEITGTDAHSESVRRDIDLFVRQEGVHFAVHTEFNTMLARSGFPDLPWMEAEMDKSYRQMLKTKSLKYLVAYCESFEILGPIFANVWLDDIADFFEGADSEAAAMFKWHISEEFEHKTVCYDVYNKLFGGYFYRIRAMSRTRKHMGDYIKGVLGYILQQEWASMTAADIAASRMRMKSINGRIGRLALKHLWRVYLPGYTPRKAKVPRNYAGAIGAIERDYAPQPA
jgi:predicted metal-dependent hydrolase